MCYRKMMMICQENAGPPMAALADSDGMTMLMLSPTIHVVGEHSRIQFTSRRAQKHRRPSSISSKALLRKYISDTVTHGCQLQLDSTVHKKVKQVLTGVAASVTEVLPRLESIADAFVLPIQYQISQQNGCQHAVHRPGPESTW